MNGADRLHAFDNLRAVMMWLGILLHVAINHTTGPSPLPWRDSRTTPLADLVLLFIHAFRMPVFFILAGFFVALLVARRGYAGMLRQRLRRLLLPFVVFWPILIVCTTLLMLVYVHVMARGTIGIDVSLLARKGAGASPFNTMHMWFLYYLTWFCVLTAALAPLWERASPALRQAVDTVYLALARNWWGLLLLAIPLAVVGSFYRAGMLASSGSFMPQLPETVHNGLFFVFGLLAYRHQDSLFPRFVKTWPIHAIVGLAVFVVVLGLFKTFVTRPGAVPHIEVWIAFLYNLASWLWSLALIGLFLRYLPRQNRVLRYVSESSYWVFLVHMLGTIGFGILVYSLPAGPLVKMLINVAATTAACLLSYQLFVRRTFVGVLLNGRRLPGASPSAAPAPHTPSAGSGGTASPAG
ncbi:acyltransferase family protein [Massilia sp. Dwa41.01b]|uniref:acyltransferase family protein n=1 Tax=unclassified Massilia TaxID=2609279 RepID=UPI0016036A3B|nr:MULTISPECIES: acyltransferase family protein [unclassified Massilia]QNA89645.1 acyltransferase family protein [Massilia sp. Dwa41.01b]QNB00544.1 acyltransferase family protein [Massilia sp. Se16.2.3]